MTAGVAVSARLVIELARAGRATDFVGARAPGSPRAPRAILSAQPRSGAHPRVAIAANLAVVFGGAGDASSRRHARTPGVPSTPHARVGAEPDPRLFFAADATPGCFVFHTACRALAFGGTDLGIPLTVLEARAPQPAATTARTQVFARTGAAGTFVGTTSVVLPRAFGAAGLRLSAAVSAAHAADLARRAATVRRSVTSLPGPHHAAFDAGGALPGAAALRRRSDQRIRIVAVAADDDAVAIAVVERRDAHPFDANFALGAGAGSAGTRRATGAGSTTGADGAVRGPTRAATVVDFEVVEPTQTLATHHREHARERDERDAGRR